MRDASLVAPPTVAFGPQMNGWGSWDWIGADLSDELATALRTVRFERNVPDADAIVIVKHPPPADWVEQACRRSALVFCPVDFYPSAAAIEEHRPFLTRCDRIVVHCDRLRRWFAPHAPVEYLDHHVKFVCDIPARPNEAGPILWTGVHSNLPPLVDWVNAHPLPAPLQVLTNFDGPVPSTAELGFRDVGRVRIEAWSPQAHRRAAEQARAAIEIKGDDFRARHKPPAKAIDFIASGLPLAMNSEAAAVDHLARMGFEVASPSDPQRWFSRDYRDDTAAFGTALRELCSRRRVGIRLRRIIEDVLASRR